jgi:small subunit ribosomal protein S18
MAYKQQSNQRRDFKNIKNNQFVEHKKRCEFCTNKIDHIDYKDHLNLRKYTTYFAKIKPRYYNGNCLRHQKMVARAIKRARHLALMPFVR